MARLFGVTLPNNKRLEYALTYVHGVGHTRSLEIIDALGFDVDMRAKDLTQDQTKQIQDFISKHYKVEDELRREVMYNVRRLREAGTYRGARHANGLPARGQRTKTNSRTVRGNTRYTAGSGRKKSAEKT